MSVVRSVVRCYHNACSLFVDASIRATSEDVEPRSESIYPFGVFNVEWLRLFVRAFVRRKPRWAAAWSPTPGAG